jgi:hypothetical protein
MNFTMNLNDLGEKQSKIISERIHHVEKNLELLAKAFSKLNYNQTKFVSFSTPKRLLTLTFLNFRVRDRTDNLAKTINEISTTERYNQTTKKAFEKLANGLTLVADEQSFEIERVEKKILPELTQYQSVCQNAKEEIKNQIGIRDREIAKRRQMEVSKRIKNENEIFSSMQEIELISEQFESQKIKDIKECMENFILIQLKYHAACIEIFSELSREVDEIDEKTDLKVNWMKLVDFLDDSRTFPLVWAKFRFKGICVASEEC